MVCGSAGGANRENTNSGSPDPDMQDQSTTDKGVAKTRLFDGFLYNTFIKPNMLIVK